MKEYVSLNPSTMLNPSPVVLVSCAEKGKTGKRDLVTVAWAGTVNSEPPMVSVSLRKERYSHGLISASGEFVVNLVDEGLARATDFCGVRSGRDIDKAAELGLTLTEAEGLEAAPRVDGAPVSLACRVRQVLELGSHDMFLAEVTAVTVDSTYIDESGKFQMNQTGLTVYSHGKYLSLGKTLGKFGYSVKKPAKKRRR